MLIYVPVNMKRLVENKAQGRGIKARGIKPNILIFHWPREIAFDLPLRLSKAYPPPPGKGGGKDTHLLSHRSRFNYPKTYRKSSQRPLSPGGLYVSEQTVCKKWILLIR